MLRLVPPSPATLVRLSRAEPVSGARSCCGVLAALLVFLTACAPAGERLVPVGDCAPESGAGADGSTTPALETETGAAPGTDPSDADGNATRSADGGDTLTLDGGVPPEPAVIDALQFVPEGPSCLDATPPEPMACADAGCVLSQGGHVLLHEEVAATVRLADGVAAPGVRVLATGLPPGAAWDEDSRTLRFLPDFTQGGGCWDVVLSVRGSAERRALRWALRVDDTIQPPPPTIDAVEQGADFRRLILTQPTDSFLDSPQLAGRTFRAVVSVPDGASASSPAPVILRLHMLGGAPTGGGSSQAFVIEPADPQNTYWWGYRDDAGTAVPPYTLRRALALLEWVLRTQPGADPERVQVEGLSMGAAGAMTLGTRWARHFAAVRAQWGQTVARHHRPERVAQLSGVWGTPEQNVDGVWDRMDAPRTLAELAEARDQFFFTRHGKDDAAIHFSAAVTPSPRTGLSFLATLQALGIGHLSVWDESGHTANDKVMGAGWWDNGWHPVLDSRTFLRRSCAFPAFSASALDESPGAGPNGRRVFDAATGYAGDPAVAGDTGWDGAVAGAHNRFLRWDATRTVDTLDALEFSLFVVSGDGAAPPAGGYPTRGERLPVPPPVHASVTPRRVQAFRLRPDEAVRWTFGGETGLVVADALGRVTVPNLPLGTTPTVLRLTRVD